MTLEVKNQKRMELAQWIDELIVETRNGDNDVGAVVHKRVGKMTRLTGTRLCFVRVHASTEAGGVLMGQWEMDLSWHADASCRDLNVEDFYSDSDDNSGERKRYEYHKERTEEGLRQVPCGGAVPEPCVAIYMALAGPRTRTAGSCKKLGIICMILTMHESQAIAARAKIAKQRERCRSCPARGGLRALRLGLPDRLR